MILPCKTITFAAKDVNVYLDCPSSAHGCCTGPVSVVVDKVKEAVGAIEEIVDENILDYCSLDNLVGVPEDTTAALTRTVGMM